MSGLDLQLIEEEQRKCLKCGHSRQSSDAGPDYACPACGAVYAKLEALQKARAEAEEKHQAESTNFERRLALQEKFEREQVAREAKEGPRYAAAHTVYLLLALPFAVTQAAAIVIAYQMHRGSDDSWLNDHFHWQIKTFWYLLGLALLAGAALLVSVVSMSGLVLLRDAAYVQKTFESMGAFAAVCAVALITAVYRIGKGWYRLSQRESP